MENTQLTVQENYAVSTSSIIFNSEKMNNIKAMAEIMSQGVTTVPKHLQKSSADCMAVIIQAIQWGMNPFAVAQKTHLVNGTLGYEGQLVNAVITSMSATDDRLHYEKLGDWTQVIGKVKEKTAKNGGTYIAPAWTLDDEKGLGVKIWATMKGENEPRVLVLLLSQAQVRNSTLWASDPYQQLCYLAAKRWARLYCPDVIMGVYTPDELIETDNHREPKDITPSSTAKAYANMIEQKNDIAQSQVVGNDADDADKAVLKQFKVNLIKLGVKTPEQYSAFLDHADIEIDNIEQLKGLICNNQLLSSMYNEFKDNENNGADIPDFENFNDEDLDKAFN